MPRTDPYATPEWQHLLSIDPDTGLMFVIIENMEVDSPCLKRTDCKFRVALMTFSGAVWQWASHIVEAGEDKGGYGIDSLEITTDNLDEVPLHTRVEALKLMATQGGWGYIPRAFAEDEDLTQLINYTHVSRGAKTYKDETTLIAKHSLAIFKKALTPDEVWNALPKELMLLKLGAWYAAATALEMQEREAVPA